MNPKAAGCRTSALASANDGRRHPEHRNIDGFPWKPKCTAQYNLGLLYDRGYGGLLDDFVAVDNGKGLEQGDAASNRGQRVPRAYAEAVHWYRRAAEQGHVYAQSNLGIMYAEGRGVPRDYAEAVRWYRKAAEQGDAEAQGNLGVMYQLGRGVPQDYAEAVRWYRKAAEQGEANSQYKPWPHV